MFAEIKEEFITIYKKSDNRIELLEEENSELNKNYQVLTFFCKIQEMEVIKFFRPVSA